ncbi:MAG: hypothetical protein HYZ37_02590 [Candidatus Solibacter usitatus]|nr:hypothetical protein [Candidatus Solibacter usitatus]
MKKRLPLMISCLVVMAGLFLTSTMSFGKPEFSKTEKKACTVCHTAMKSKDLNKVGECYKDKKNLKECAK